VDQLFTEFKGRHVLYMAVDLVAY